MTFEIIFVLLALLGMVVAWTMFSQKGKHLILVGEAPVSTDDWSNAIVAARADYVREKAYSLEKKLRAKAKHG